jgi:hypothetical protein
MFSLHFPYYTFRVQLAMEEQTYEVLARRVSRVRKVRSNIRMGMTAGEAAWHSLAVPGPTTQCRSRARVSSALAAGSFKSEVSRRA